MNDNKNIKEMKEFEIKNIKKELTNKGICPLIQKKYDLDEILLKESSVNFINCPLQKQSCSHSVFYGTEYICKIKLEVIDKINKKH
ncbi:MAG: hypothetical protein KGY67_00960 [Candidatus Thermoplasmatota archaeon]|nr:hypothetical protein [Candidatus Thermoplasmatota archaeon]